MTLTMPFSTRCRPSLAFLFFAKLANQEPDDDGFEDLDDGHFEDIDDGRQNRPRRPFFTIILAMLLVAGMGYVAMDPDRRSSITKLATWTIGARLGPDADAPVLQPNDKEPVLSSQAAPIPVFHEGQRVFVTLKGGVMARLRLKNDAKETRHGPSVKNGDVVTIVDGRFIKNRWVYRVRTHSGASGWIREGDLQAQP